MSEGFAEEEYRARLAAAQARMGAAGFGALLLTAEADFRYFSGFLTRFWESPSRPWFLVLAAHGDPVAVIPEIGAALMQRTWVRDIRTWPAPRPDDDGISLLAEALREIGGPVGVPSGPESMLRMPLDDFERVRRESGLEWRGDAGIVAALRSVKSEAEIARIRQSCAVAGRAFGRLDEIVAPGVPLARVFRDFQRLLLEEGADCVPYLAGGAGPDGYGDVISPATEAPLAVGDVLMLDTGAVKAGYFCDFDRNVAIGHSLRPQQDAHRRLIEAVRAGLDTARPGALACDVWRAMAAVTGTAQDEGRLGHGLGMQLTEGLSLTARDRTELHPGMVITLEPGVVTGPGRIMVHEEVVAIRAGAAEALSPLARPELPVI